MSGFENYFRQAEQLELEIERKGIALGIDWSDVAAVEDLARQALDANPQMLDCDHNDPRQHALCELFGLAQLMLQVMEESAHQKMHTHGGPAWKAFGGALWKVWQSRKGAVS